MALPKIITCYTTITDQQSAERLINQLLETRLIACGVSWSVHSQYKWQNELRNEGEYVVFMKSSVDVKERLVSRIQDFHPYDVPCVLIQEVESNPAYCDWVREQTAQ